MLFFLRYDLSNAQQAFNYSVLWILVQLSSYFVDGAKAFMLREAQRTIPNFARSISNYQIYGILRPGYLFTILKYIRFNIVKVYFIFALTSVFILGVHGFIVWKIVSLILIEGF